MDHEVSGTVRRRPRRWQRLWLDMSLGAVLMLLVHSFVVQISVVRGHSMEPSLLDGDRLMVDRVSNTAADVNRGDVVVMRCPRNPSIDYVKRVVGVPGDRVSLHGGVLFVNGLAVDDGFDWIADHDDMAPVAVPDGHFFVLGDNRPISSDSREFGLVAEELLKGRVRIRFWPLSRMQWF